MFNALHGRWGEDGTIQGLLDILAIPYTHSGLLASALAMHKPTAKLIFERAGIPVAEHVVVGREALGGGDPLPRPYVVKPLNEGSSVGVRIVRNGDNLGAARRRLELRRARDGRAVHPGREFTVAVMGDRALAVTEITTDRGFYDYDAKYAPGGSRHVVPAQVDPARLRRGDGARAARPSGARLPRRLSRRPPLRRRAAVHARGQHPAGHDADFAGPRTGGLRRHRRFPTWSPGWSRTRSATDETAPAPIRGKRGGQPRPRVVPMWRTRRRWPALRGDFLRHALRRRMARLAGRYAAARAATRCIRSSSASARPGSSFATSSSSAAATPKATLLHALAVRRGTPILAVDLEAARQRIQALPWVRHASVRRVLPDTVDRRDRRAPAAGAVAAREEVRADRRGGPGDPAQRRRRLQPADGRRRRGRARQRTALVQMLATEPDLMPRG